ncbi:transporter substrate-binding domain-containing protein [Desulfobacterales bacterium HSG2]|nr:transporter substrate-binding domain-containing protein [Desulfobacterales bacterium HSG2]
MFFFSTSALAEELAVVYANWAPYTFTKDGKATGIIIDTVNEACKRLNIVPKLRLLPWKRALKYMKKGKMDALLTPIYTEERTEFMYYSSEPANIERTVFLTWKGSGIKVNGLDDLKGKSVAVVRGYSYTSEFDSRSDIKKIECNDDEQAVRILAKKRVIVTVGEEGVLRFFAKQIGTQVEVVGVLTEVPGYMCFSKKALGQKGKTMAEEFGKTLRQLKKEGVIEKIRSSYF